MHTPSTPGTVPMSHPSLLLLQHQQEPLAGGGAGAEQGAGAQGWACTHRTRVKPALAKD